jgi:hypothetical protein
MRSFVLCLLLAFLSSYSSAFVQPNALTTNVQHKRVTNFDPLQRASPAFPLSLRLNDEDDKKVNVNLIPDVDSFTLTAVGFGLIAFNFLVLANLGDLGVGGFIARIINTFG